MNLFRRSDLPLSPALVFYLAEHQNIEALIETAIETIFDKQIEGSPSDVSQYGVPYDYLEIYSFHMADGAAAVVKDLASQIGEWMKHKIGDRAIVWRVRPFLSPETLDGKPVIACRFRAHTLKEIPECLP